MTEHRLAQVTVGVINGEMDSELMRGFAERLEEINARAIGSEEENE